MAYVVLAEGGTPRGHCDELRSAPARAAAGLHGPRRLRARCRPCRSPPTARSTSGPCRAARLPARRTARRPAWRRARRSRSCWPAIWPRCWGRERGRRRTTTSSPSAATRSWPRGWPPGCAAAFGVELPLRGLFEAPTVAGLASRIEAARAAAPAARKRRPCAGAPPRGDGCRSPSPRSGSGSSTSSSRRRRPTTCPYFARGPAGRSARRSLERALGEVVRRHEVLRTTLPGGGRTARAGDRRRRRPSPLPLSSTSACCPAGARPARRRSGWPAERGRPPLRPGARTACCAPLLLRLTTSEHVVPAHPAPHRLRRLVARACSPRELAALYAAFAEGRAIALPELRLQYADYARWQRGWLQGEVAGEQLAYWSGRLAGGAAAAGAAHGPAAARRCAAAGGGAVPVVSAGGSRPRLRAARAAARGRRSSWCCWPASQALLSPHRPGATSSWARPSPAAPGPRSRS